MLLKSINPATGEVVRDFPETQWDEVDVTIRLAKEAFLSWKKTEVLERKIHMLELAKLLILKKEGLAFNISIEMGKPIAEARAEIEKCASVCEYYAEYAEEFLKPQNIATSASQSYISYQAIGVILGIMPWNFPFWQAFRFLAPTLMAGNTIILKHASNVPGCAQAIEDLMFEAGFPDNVFRVILVSNQRVEQIIANKRISAVTLTGSTPAGKAVASIAGKYLKKTVLELGGSDPYLILEDAHLESAVDACVKGRMVNTGQSCIGAKRFIVVEEIYKNFEEMFVEKMRKVKMGDPFNEENQIGPMARCNLREDLLSQVNKSVSKGAKVLCGGDFTDEPGFFFPPTVLTQVAKGMPAYDQELFGPVASLIKVKNQQQGIEIANDTIYGLGSAVFTADIERGRRIAEYEIEAGCCFVNDFVRSDPRLPFGGIKESGYGRELSYLGMHEFLNVKTVYIK